MIRWLRFQRPAFLAVIFTMALVLLPKQNYDSTDQRDARSALPVLVRKAGSCSSEFKSNHSLNQTGWRQFDKHPITVKDIRDIRQWDKCQVGCRYTSRAASDQPSFDIEMGGNEVLLSMESSQYYPSVAVETAHKSGVRVVMTTDLRSDVPAGYFSWAEYGLLDPPRVPTSERIDKAVVVISNCQANSFRMEAVQALIDAGVPVDRFGHCFGRRATEDKLELISRYKFYLSFENSIEPDYVTEKFWQPLVVGTVPVVIGAPNIQDFAPSKNSILHIGRLEDVPAVADRMKQLMADQGAYNEMLEWKSGPDEQFLALIDMAVVHSACRLCIHLATEIRQRDINVGLDEASCKCSLNPTVRRLLVRERGRMEFESIAFNVEAGDFIDLRRKIKLHFESIDNGSFRPIWSGHRRDILGTEMDLKLYRIYPVGLTQRDALYSPDKYISDIAQLRELITQQPCPQLEVIFV